MDSRSLKRPKLEVVSRNNGVEEGKEDLESLVIHHTSEVQHLKKQLEEAEKRLVAAQLKLRRRSSSSELQAGNQIAGNGSSSGASSRPQLLIPSVDRSSKTPMAAKGPLLIGSTPKPTSRFNAEDSRVGSSSRPTASLGSQTRHKIEQKDHKDLIPGVGNCSSARLFNFAPMAGIPSRHNRKIRCLEANPTDDRMFVTSALNGTVNIWKLQADGSKPNALLLSTIDCEIPERKKWPEDLAWHPNGEMLFCAYGADGGGPQVSTVDLKATGKDRVSFLDKKPHLKGTINSIIFLHGIDMCFATGGSDHAVILWKRRNGFWKPKVLHQNQHSSTVKGVASLQHMKILLSVGLDKKIIGFDILADKCGFQHQINHQCMSVLPNPCDVNLYMVQTSEHGRQLRLYDIRSREREIHTFGWKQSSESKSGLISQSWSHDGWHLSSGSLDPAIHLFDIRCNGKGPSQTIHAHQRRVFKAIWHQSIPLMTSVSSDHNIGLHEME
ncbi:uncharacterized protein LOC120275385 isoform X2 [Dioscorea cayenensis subsp. rotundata]|uniref:Uncharacterized protein LOC120275385 isoform X2 n=1 Tax=Dioscorea cayennensis subsp. rotundata TaxID=55577 RepID=A0AB40CD93_DIOCR|nr:uncharacterized protein LOC120275385 isoform X2 [Dioscorea cayenensis subsp. rotundata]